MVSLKLTNVSQQTQATHTQRSQRSERGCVWPAVWRRPRQAGSRISTALPGPLRIGISFGSSSGLASSSVATSSARSLSLNSATQRLLHVLVAITGEVLALLGHPHAPRHTTHWSARDLRSYGTCECRSPPRHKPCTWACPPFGQGKEFGPQGSSSESKIFFRQEELA